MRALCGAIIAAGAMIGLGLATIGYGLRYQSYPYVNTSGEAQWVYFRHLDSTLMLVIIVLVVGILIGLATAFVGLSFHHHRRLHELNLLGSRTHATDTATTH